MSYVIYCHVICDVIHEAFMLFFLFVAGLFLAGMLLFSGGCYGFALWQNKTLRSMTPFGGMLLIAAWLSFLL